MRVYLLFLCLLICSFLKAQDNGVLKVEFQSLSRTYFEKVTITKDSLITQKKQNRRSEETITSRELSKKEWKTLLKITQALSLKEIPILKSPTMKRAYDGARHSTLTVHTKHHSYEHLFDDENPNSKLQHLMNFISELKQ